MAGRQCLVSWFVVCIASLPATALLLSMETRKVLSPPTEATPISTGYEEEQFILNIRPFTLKNM